MLRDAGQPWRAASAGRRRHPEAGPDRPQCGRSSNPGRRQRPGAGGGPPGARGGAELSSRRSRGQRAPGLPHQRHHPPPRGRQPARPRQRGSRGAPRDPLGRRRHRARGRDPEQCRHLVGRSAGGGRHSGLASRDAHPLPSRGRRAPRAGCRRGRPGPRGSRRLPARRGPDAAAAVPVQLRAGQEVEVRVEHRPDVRGRYGFVTMRLGIAPQKDDDTLLEEAVQAAAAADVAVVVVGSADGSESEGYDRETMVLPGRQDELVRRVAAANARTVVVVNSGMPVLMPWVDDVAAVIQAWLPGQAFGEALADVLLGVIEPGGRLPVSLPRAEADSPVLHA
ncbi:MAG: hypothetical protein E6J29_02855, partial [Chloroflexi bacterium]